MPALCASGVIVFWVVLTVIAFVQVRERKEEKEILYSMNIDFLDLGIKLFVFEWWSTSLILVLNTSIKSH